MNKWYENMEYAELRKLSDIRTGYKYPISSYVGEDYITAKFVSGIVGPNIIFGEPIPLEISYREITKYQVKPGDVIFSSRTSPNQIGKYAIADAIDLGLCSSNNIRIRTNPGLDPYFLLLMFGEFHKEGVFKKMARITANIASITVSQLGSLKIPDISLELQKQKIIEYSTQGFYP